MDGVCAISVLPRWWQGHTVHHRACNRRWLASPAAACCVGAAQTGERGTCRGPLVAEWEHLPLHRSGIHLPSDRRADYQLPCAGFLPYASRLCAGRLRQQVAHHLRPRRRPALSLSFVRRRVPLLSYERCADRWRGPRGSPHVEASGGCLTRARSASNVHCVTRVARVARVSRVAYATRRLAASPPWLASRAARAAALMLCAVQRRDGRGDGGCGSRRHNILLQPKHPPPQGV
mmetsp:Transcript_21052/g.53877  ORF Transcript_21052/g.53877 Transcript_21052/m.53877 type:complete len:233 (-) Transcript_21052:1041-1739(-)